MNLTVLPYHYLDNFPGIIFTAGRLIKCDATTTVLPLHNTFTPQKQHPALTHTFPAPSPTPGLSMVDLFTRTQRSTVKRGL